MTLIEKLEAAPEGSRELDTEIAQAVFPKLYRRGAGDFEAWYIDDMLTDIEPFSTSLDAAMQLVPEGWAGGGRLVGAPPFPMELVRLNKPGYVSSTGQNPALALSAASLKAHAAVKETER